MTGHREYVVYGQLHQKVSGPMWRETPEEAVKDAISEHAGMRLNLVTKLHEVKETDGWDLKVEDVGSGQLTYYIPEADFSKSILGGVV